MARQLIIELVGKDTTLSKSLDDADKKVGGFSTSLGGAAKAAGALIGGGAAISFLKASTEQATEAAQAQSQLENALKNSAAAAGTTASDFDSFNKALARHTLADDDVIASGEAIIANFGLTKKQIEDITPTIADVAAKMGTDIPSAADSVGKALLGNTKALKSLGIDGFKPTGDRARDLATLQDLLQSKTKGAAQAQLDAAGPGATLKKSMDELQESVGGLLLPVLQKAAEVGATITDFLTNMDGPTKILVLSVGALAGAVVALNLAQSVWTTLTEAATVAQAALNLVMSANPIALVAIGIAGLVAAGVLLVKNWDTVKGAFSATFGWIKDRFDDFIGLFDGLPGKIGAAVKGLAGVITAPFRLEFNAVSGLWNNSVGSLSFHVPDWVPGLGGKGFSFPKLPTLAQGGITTGPTVALIGDNPGGREAVIPLPPGADTGDIGGGPTGPIVIQLVVGKQVLTEVVHSGLLDKKQRTGTLGLS